MKNETVWWLIPLIVSIPHISKVATLKVFDNGATVYVSIPHIGKVGFILTENTISFENHVSIPHIGKVVRRKICLEEIDPRKKGFNSSYR